MNPSALDDEFAAFDQLPILLRYVGRQDLFHSTYSNILDSVAIDPFALDNEYAALDQLPMLLPNVGRHEFSQSTYSNLTSVQHLQLSQLPCLGRPAPADALQDFWNLLPDFPRNNMRNSLASLHTSPTSGALPPAGP